MNIQNADEAATTGVMVIRAWIEPGPGDGLRVRVTHSIGDGHAQPTTDSAATVDGACAIVRSWLDELARRQPRSRDAGGPRHPTCPPPRPPGDPPAR